MKTIEQQIKARQALTQLLSEFVQSEGERKDRLFYKFETGIQFYQQMYGETWIPYYEVRE